MRRAGYRVVRDRLTLADTKRERELPRRFISGDRPAWRVDSNVRSPGPFCGMQGTVAVPVFLIANPDEAQGGGGGNGGRLVVEVPFSDALAFLLHESLHFLLVRHDELIRKTAAAAGLTWQMLNEGVAYALAPGIISERQESDPLAEALARFLLRGTPASDPYVQSKLDGRSNPACSAGIARPRRDHYGVSAQGHCPMADDRASTTKTLTSSRHWSRSRGVRAMAGFVPTGIRRRANHAGQVDRRVTRGGR